MVVGESGGGKTTACTTLLRGFDELKDHHYEIEVLQDASGKTLNIGRLGVVDTTTDPAQPSATHIYDSNGYGDSVNNQSDFDAIRNYIVERHRKYYSTPLHGRTADQHKEFDERIHCCLYFISPHRMKRIDEIFIESLADVVNIVPIVAKADTMTMEEREKFLQEVVARIAKIQERVRRKHDLRAIFQFDLQDAAVKFMKKRRIREDPDAHITQVKSNGKILNDSKGRSIHELFPSKLSGESDDDDDDDDDDDLYECAKAASEGKIFSLLQTISL
jgi:septin family protein